MDKRLALALTAGLVVGTSLPAAALERLPPCPNTLEDGGECLGPLAAGNYRTTVFETPFTLSVPDGWANYEDLPGNFLLVPPGGSLEGVNAGTSDYIGIYQGVAVSEATCQSFPEPGIGTDAASMAEALAGRDGLAVSDPVPVDVGGLSGLMIDIATDTASGTGCQVPDLSFPIVPLIIGTGPAGLEHAQFGDPLTRYYLLDHANSNIAIEVTDVPGESGTTEDYVGVIESIDFELPGE